MSRIDDALRRASRGGNGFADATVETSAAADRSASRTVSSALHHYDTEKRHVTPEEAHDSRPPVQEPKSPVARLGAFAFAPWLRNKVVLSGEMKDVALEHYRRLAAELHDLQTERGFKTLMVSSAVPQEGKTLTVINLALTLSESYNRRVLLIDADLRRPSIHESFGIPNGVGLAGAVRGANGSLPLVEVSPRLHVVTAGRPNKAAPMAELTSERLPALIKQASSQFDWVLIDTPPTGILPDAQLLARVADGILFIIRAGSTPYALVQRALGALGDRVVGTVLNSVAPDTLRDEDAYSSYYGQDSAKRRT